MTVQPGGWREDSMFSRVSGVFVWMAAFFSGALGAAEMQPRLEAERGKLLAGSTVQVGAVLTLEAPEAPGDAAPVSVSLALVLDHSGSMSEAGKIEMVHVAGADLVDRLNASDAMGLVAFNSNVQVLRPMAPLADAPGVKGMIRELRTGSNTNLGGGLQTGLGLFGNAAAGGEARRLLLLSDGLANEGETNVETLAGWAKESFLKGTRVSCVGLGRDYNEQFLTRIAHAGGGDFYYVAKREQLPELFRRELEEGRQVTVAGLNMTVRTGPGARFLEAVGYPPTGGDETARQVRLGDLYAKEKRCPLLRFDLAVPGDRGVREWQAAELELTWTNFDKKSCRAVLPLTFGVTAVESDVVGSTRPEVRARVTETENYRSLDKAMDLFRKGDQKGSLELLKEAEARASKEAAATGDKALLGQAGQLAQARREVEGLVEARDAQIYNSAQGCFGYRDGGGRGRKSIVSRFGGSSATESAVELALTWLASVQKPDGSWDAPAAAGEASSQNETSFALLAFLGAGYTENSGKYAANVKLAADWLAARQQADGRIGVRGEIPAVPVARFRARWSHALAALALAEAAGMTQIAERKASAQKAADWLAAQRPLATLDKDMAGARELTPDDVAGVGWCVMALKSAKLAGLNVDNQALTGAVAFLDGRAVQPAAGKPVAGWDFFSAGGPQQGRLADTAVALTCLGMLGAGRDQIAQGVEWMTRQSGALPAWGKDGASFDWHYAYFGNLACFQSGGDAWRTWNDNLRSMLVDNQKKDGAARGSWEPAGTLSGRAVAASALGALCMEVYYRYLPMYR